MEIFSFPSISDSRSEVLVLGTMPGEMSLRLNQYYRNKGNHFWRIMVDLHRVEFSADYEQRRKLLLDNRIALWDVLKACVREGSADSAILEEKANDFLDFFSTHKAIRAVAFNGKNAASFFERHVGEIMKVPRIILPSTSPANGWSSYQEKLEQWRSVLTTGIEV
jgi:hypoxanthine-DNA glycosylase